jgi:hypothetical protein
MPVSRPVLLLLCLQWGSSAGFLAPGYGHATCAAPHCRQPAVVAQYRGRGGGGRGRGRGGRGRGRGRGPFQQEQPQINENIGDFAEVRVLVDVPGESDELVRTCPEEQTNRNRDHSGFPYTDLFPWTLYVVGLRRGLRWLSCLLARRPVTC